MAGESRLEDYLEQEAARMGGKAIKTTSPHDGWPDRLVILPGARIGFLELKDRRKTLRPLQRYWLKKLRSWGCYADWASTQNEVDEWLSGLVTSHGPIRPE